MGAVIAAIGGGSFVLASWFLGPRLIWLSRKTGEAPEFFIGLGLFLMAALGYPLLVASQVWVDGPHDLRMTLIVASCLTGAIGQSAIAVFTRRVFRPDDAWATALMLAIVLTYPIAFSIHAGSPGLETLLESKNGPWRATLYATNVNIAWAALESFLYWGRLRKRMALGLADAVVTNRMGLWALGIGAAATIGITVLVLEAFGVPVNGVEGAPIQATVIGPLGAVCSISLWLAFLPPSWYTRRIAARSAQPA